MYKHLQVTTILNVLEDISTSNTIIITIKQNCPDITLASRVYQITSIPLSQNNIKTKKCQPDAGDRPDLIQTVPVPSG